MNKNSLRDYIKAGKITKQRKFYRCDKCNYLSGTPFEAMKCYDNCARKEVQQKKEKATSTELYWNQIGFKERESIRKQFNNLSDIEQDRFKTVADYGYLISSGILVFNP